MAREKRLIVGKGSYDNVLLCPPLTITKKECDVALDTLGEILSEVDNQVKN
jgi:4-aminobutyrate aminotransferase-like enzyme